MAIPSVITDLRNKYSARVTKFGQLVTAPLEYSSPILVELSIPDVPVNVITPSQGQVIIITDILASADKDVSNTTPANVVVYQSDAVDSNDVSDPIVRPQLVRADNFPLTGMNLRVPEGKWVNAITNDAGILLTVMFYRAPLK